MNSCTGYIESLVLFQTPSERGGIVLTYAQKFVKAQPKSFKPLQNGAVLCWFHTYVKILDTHGSFKPLQNGAVLC